MKQNQPSPDFLRAAMYVLQKNGELYRRLARRSPVHGGFPRSGNRPAVYGGSGAANPS
jgi:hypothetical protein